MPITFRCTCGKVMQAKDEYAGRQVKCGGCGMIVLIPGSDAAPTLPHVRSGEAPTMPPPAFPDTRSEPRDRTNPDDFDRRSGSPDDDWDRQGSRQPRTRQGMALWAKLLIVFIALGVLGGGVVVLIMALSGKGVSSQFAMVPRDAALVATIRVSDVWTSKSLESVKTKFGADLETKMKQELGMGPDQIDRITVVMPDLPDIPGPGGPRRGPVEPDFWIIVHTKSAIDKEKVLKSLLPAREEKSAGGKTYSASARMGIHFASDMEAWLAAPAVLASLLDGSRKISRDGPMNDTLALASTKHMVVGVNLPEKFRDKLVAEAGRELPGFPFRDLLGGTITYDGAGGDLDYRIKFAKADSAAEATGVVKVAMGKMREDFRRKGFPGGMPGDMPPDFAMMFDKMDKMMDGIKIETKGSEVVMTMPNAGEALTMMTMVLTPVRMGRDKVEVAAGRVHAINDVRQMLLGMHVYHDLHKSLPPAKFRGGLSWRVAILPYIEQDALYREFKLDESWDSPHNIKLLDRMPDIFRPVAGPPAKAGYTCYQVFTGPDLVFTEFGESRFRKLAGVPDGTSNTVFIAESGNLVPWSAPQDIRFEKFGGMPRLGYQFPGVFIAGFGDSNVETLPVTLTREQLMFIVDPADGRFRFDLPIPGGGKK